MPDEQLDLFPPTTFAVTSKGDEVTFSYFDPHSISVPQDDTVLLKYEIVRLVKSGIATIKEVAARFQLHHGTVSNYCHNLETGGIDGLRDHRLGPLSVSKRLATCRELYKLYQQNPTYSARQLHKLLTQPNRLSINTVKSILAKYRRGLKPKDLPKSRSSKSNR